MTGTTARGLHSSLATLCLVLVLPVTAWSQGSTTATVRGNIQDPTGAVIPGATVTMTNVGTRTPSTSVSDERGQYFLAGLFPGTYDLKVELTGFKTYEQKGITLSPTDNRGIDIRLELGQQSETVTVTSQVEVIQTETGAREGVLNSKQIDNLSVIGRSSLELLRILPGVVAPDQADLESVSFGGGANNTQGYTVNGIRSSSNTVQLDGSSLIDIGSNSGVIVTLNNDMVQEVKVQSSNFAAEYGSGGMNVSAVTKGGSSRFSGTVYDYWRDHRFGANDRSNSITGTPKPKSTFNYPGGNIGGPILIPGVNFNRGRDKAFFFAGLEIQRQKVDPGSFLSTTLTDKMKRGDLSELLPGNCVGQNLNYPCAQFNIPRGFPGEGTPAPNNNFAPYIQPLGRILAGFYPSPNLNTANNRYNYNFSTLQPTNRYDFKFRIDYNITNNTRAYVRTAIEGENAENARGIWWPSSDLALPTPTYGDNKGRSVSGNVVSVLSPSMTNEILVSWSRLTLDNFWRDPSKVRIDAYPELAGYRQGFFPNQSPYLPINIITSGWGQGGPGNLWAPAMDVFAHNDALQFSDKLTKIAGSHGMKFGFTAERGQKQQNFQNDEMGQLQFDPWATGGTGSAIADLLTGRLAAYTQGTQIPEGQWQYWNLDGFAQDSWKLRSNLTLEFGVRGGYWTNNYELNDMGGYFDPSLYDPSKATFLDPGTYQKLNGWRYASAGQAPRGGVDNRSPFAMPRVNLAWDVTGNSNNVLRGGFGIFYNRNMGNLEYDYLRIPPTSYNVAIGSADGSSLGGGVGLTYDTIRQLDWTTRVSTLTINTLNPTSNKWPRTYSFSASYARRIFFNQVIEAAYVGTRGRDLVSRRQLNVVPLGALLSGTVNGVNLAVPVNRVALADSVVNQFRPYQAYPGIQDWSFEGESEYNSLQLTLSRQTGRRLQYFAAYTFGRNKGTTSGNGEYGFIDPFDPSRTYGVLPQDRTHILNVSWNAFLPDGAKGAMDNPFGRGLLNGWQLSGISTLASGVPIFLGFSGQAGGNGVTQAIFGTPDIIGNPGPGGGDRGGLAPMYTCDPRTGLTGVGEKILDINCIKIPAFGENGPLVPPYNLRMPTRINHDLTLFKNFEVTNGQKFQFRVGFFNLFNQAWATTNSAADVDLILDTTCNVSFNGVANGAGGTADNVCDPTAGFQYTQTAKENFGKINLKRGRRVIEFVFKYYF
jgi:carboxypeptidase family protein/TonB-dependent receptor-like protein